MNQAMENAIQYAALNVLKEWRKLSTKERKSSVLKTEIINKHFKSTHNACTRAQFLCYIKEYSGVAEKMAAAAAGTSCIAGAGESSIARFLNRPMINGESRL